MNKQAIDQMWDQMRQKYGVYLRVLGSFPDDRLQTRPIRDMRTPAELVAHISGSIVRDIALGVAAGEIAAREAEEADVASGLRTTHDALEFARACWREADEAVGRIGDEELEAIVPTGWGVSFPGWVALGVLSDEFLHHRGQLYAYARACGIAPPFIWGFDENAPEFRPARAAD